MTEEKKAIKLKADVYWCQHNKVNDMSGKFQLNLCNLSDAAVEALEDMGISVQTGEEKKAEMGRYITCKSEKAIRVFDTDNDEITEAIGNLVVERHAGECGEGGERAHDEAGLVRVELALQLRV